MTASVNIASVVSFESEAGTGLFVMDATTGKFYRLSAEEVDAETAGAIMSAVRGEMRRSMPEIPREAIAEVMGAEREVYENNRGSAPRR